jgi:hypothetical protein
MRIKAIPGFVHGNFIRVLEENPSAGFLFERTDLRDASLRPTDNKRITVKRSYSLRKKLLARTWNMYGGLIETLCDILKIDIVGAMMTLFVESGGKGFINNRMIIRFENHAFWKHLSKEHAAEFDTHFQFRREKRRWTKHTFRKAKSGVWKKSWISTQRVGRFGLCEDLAQSRYIHVHKYWCATNYGI